MSLSSTAPSKRSVSCGRLLRGAQNRLEVVASATEARGLAMAAGFESVQAETLALVVAELGSNAVRYGSGGVVSVTIEPTGWTVRVEDSGPGFPPAVLADAGRSDRLGAEGVRPPADGRWTFGSGLASVRRLSTHLELTNRPSGGGLAIAHRELSPSSARRKTP